MKNLKKKVVYVMMVLGLLVGMVSHCNEVHAEVRNTKIITTVSQQYKDNGGLITEYSNGSWSYIDDENDIYEFYPTELGDWSYSCGSIEELNNLLEDYKYHYENDDVTDKFYVERSYEDVFGTKIYKFNDKSWASFNQQNGKYQFSPAITTNTIIEVQNALQLKNIISTYWSIKTTGYF